jgi:large conductance mechanosensitive channel protein
MKNFFEEFKAFLSRGNILDMAVGIIIGSAFTGIVTSLVNDIFMPVISIFTGGLSFESWAVKISDAANGGSLNYGNFISAIINFVVVAFAIFMLIRGIAKLKEATGRNNAIEEAPTEKECPFCKTVIHVEAVRCPHCTSELIEP